MQLINYLESKYKNLVNKALQFSVGNNKVCKVDITTSVIYLYANENKLVEVEVKADTKNLGWVYRDDIDFLIFDGSQNKSIIDFKTIRKIVENKVKQHGKMFCEEPKPYHIRKDEHGGAYFYLNENDLSYA